MWLTVQAVLERDSAGHLMDIQAMFYFSGASAYHEDYVALCRTMFVSGIAYSAALAWGTGGVLRLLWSRALNTSRQHAKTFDVCRSDNLVQDAAQLLPWPTVTGPSGAALALGSRAVWCCPGC